MLLFVVVDFDARAVVVGVVVSVVDISQVTVSAVIIHGACTCLVYVFLFFPLFGVVLANIAGFC